MLESSREFHLIPEARKGDTVTIHLIQRDPARASKIFTGVLREAISQGKQLRMGEIITEPIAHIKYFNSQRAQNTGGVYIIETADGKRFTLKVDDIVGPKDEEPVENDFFDNWDNS